MDPSDVDWADLTHAYGTAADVPDLLRALASDDAATAEEALSELIGSIFHQGTVYTATAPAVPFLVDLAHTAPHQRTMLTGLVGMLADPRHAYGGALPAVQQAVAEQADRLLPLLVDDDPEMRVQAVYALAQCGDRFDARVLHERWAVEDVPEVRASVIMALARRDPSGSADLLRAAVVDQALEVRVAAALGTLWAGTGWPDGAADALAEAFGARVDVDYAWQYAGSALDELVANVDGEFAASLLHRLLAAPDANARRDGLYAVGEACAVRRSAPARFVPLVGPLLDDPDPAVRREALGVLRRIGEAAGQFADALAAVAAGYPNVADAVAITGERVAVEALDRLGDPRWLEPACAAWSTNQSGRSAGQGRVAGRQPGGRGREASSEPAGSLGHTQHRCGAAFSPAVLDEVRRRLADPAVDAKVVAGLAGVVHGWGADAAPAEPELTSVLRAVPEAVALAVAKALAAIGAVVPGALVRLRAAGLAGDVECAVAVWRQTGDGAPVQAAVAGCLDAPAHSVDWDLLKAVPAGAALGPLVPRLRQYLTGTPAPTAPERRIQLAAAQMVWLATGEASAALPAAILAMGGWHIRVPAAQAMWTLGTPAGEVVPVLLDELENQGSDEALRLLVEMRAVDALPDLVRLAERDERVITSGIADDIVWADERLVRALRAAVADLSG